LANEKSDNKQRYTTISKITKGPRR